MNRRFFGILSLSTLLLTAFFALSQAEAAMREPLRWMLRCALWPVVLTASLFVLSPIAGSFLAASCALGLVVGVRKLRRHARRRREAMAATARA